MSCSGCRVLRKGCSNECTIKPCLEWIKSTEDQANATLFLAKFYGRMGLVNLINAAPLDLRPATFKSLLYEVCGRVVNPTYGCAGLLWSGKWDLCQAAVEAVLKGSSITQMSAEESTVMDTSSPFFKACDICHVSKEGEASDPLILYEAPGLVHQTRFRRHEMPNPRTVKAELNQEEVEDEAGLNLRLGLAPPC